MKKILVIILLFLSGCANFGSHGNSELKIPEEVFYSCKELTKAESSLDTDLLRQSKETIKLYQECKKWNEEKNIILKKILNNLSNPSLKGI